MVKLPTDREQVPPEFETQRTQFLHDFGAVIALWGEFELSIEVKIAQLVGLNPVDASIVLGGLNFGSKPSILYSLLGRRGGDETSAKVRAVINHVRRNSLVHGIVSGDPEVGRIAFFKREVGNAYVVKQLNYTAETFNEHWETFRRLESEALIAMDLDDNDLEKYARAAGLLAPAPQHPQDPPRNEANGSK